ncbi:hypothetical protein M527_13205 [Sphingobium indicum IP26]|uniref:Uncharacterized protein n=1 Tax=Sphingobium indicum F2 TaxID=1450518 RepID=A0A8E0WUA3_9SPHN|nr:MULTISPECIES: hypothetical protein [Sphingobium]EPR18286.1 hypothetical protein M527_13205 [Sphingobium indicum IP26]EQB06831.1 hypothetical protein L286_05795 [Sphingobium sp. HDIP04]KER37541.1 hypothetical protein AL00_04815 [Sphingobium indicum F2]
MTRILDDSTPIRADVPLSLHPDSLLGIGQALDAEGTLGTSVLAAAREALRSGYDLFGRMNDAELHLQAIADPARRRQQAAERGGRTEFSDNVRMRNGRPTRVVDADEFINAAEKAFDRVAPTIDRRVTELNGYRDTLASRVAAALDHPARKTPEGLALAAEVRAHIKALKKPDERTRFVAQAVDAGDVPTVAAVLHAQPFLSGLEPAAHAMLRARAAAKFAPVDNAQLEATEAAISHVCSSTSALVKRMGDIAALRNAPAAKAAKSLKALEGVGR